MKEEHGWQTAVRMPEIWKSRLENLGKKLSPYVHLQNSTIIRAVIERGLSTLEKEHGITVSASAQKAADESGSDTGRSSRLSRRTAAAEAPVLTSNEPHINRRGGARAKKEEALKEKDAKEKDAAAAAPPPTAATTERKVRTKRGEK
jgi:predicted DNA-binding protein